MESSHQSLTKELASLLIASKSHLHKRKTDLLRDDLFDVVVYGSGMGGLSTASLLAQLGLHVCLLEASSTVGGCVGQVCPYSNPVLSI